MALPGKRGLRPISVEGQRYRWSFRAGEVGRLWVVREEGAGERLEVVSPEWTNPWLWMGTPADAGRTFHPVTPALVARAIREALRLGWKPERAGSTFRLRWARGVCRPSEDRG